MSLFGVAGALTAVMALVAFESQTTARQLEMAGDRFLTRPLARGVYGPETAPDGMTYAWTADVMTLVLQGIDRSDRWNLSLRARPAVVDPSRPVTALVDGVVVARWAADGEFKTLSVDLRPAPRPGAVVTFTAPAATGGPNDPRVLGLLVDSITLSRDGRYVRPPATALWGATALGFAAGAALGLIDVPVLAAGAALIAIGCAYARLLSIGLTPFAGGYLTLTRGVAIAVLGAGAMARLGAWAGGGASIEARAATAAILAGTAVKALILTHPAVFLGDINFHVHRQQSVQDGHWLFTSFGPGGEFPYPVALYVAAAALRWLTRDTDLLLRLLVLAADAGAAAMVYAVGSRVWNDRRAALLATVLLVTAKATFHTQVLGFLTNGFGEGLATVTLLVIAATSLAWPLRAALGGAASLVAMLAHVSTALLLGASLAVGAVAAWWRGTGAMRRTASVALLALALSAMSAYALYYRHFTQLYRLPARFPAPISAPLAPPVQRREAHQTAWAPGAAALRARVGAVPRYTRRYFGWAPILLATIGAVAMARRADALSRLVLARLAVCAAFLVIGVVTPLDLRYYLGAAGAVALAGGFGAARGMFSTSRLTAACCSLLVGWSIVENLIYWFAWFS